jgi:hypothetical protein
LLATQFGITSSLEAEFPRFVILKRGTDEIGIPLNAPKYEVFSPFVIHRIIDRFEDLTQDRLLAAYRDFLAARRSA